MSITIRNLTRGTTVASDSGEAKSFFGKLLGLMGKKQMPLSAALVIDRTNWIHTFWMRFPLDAVYVDRHWKVVGLETNLAPNRIGRPFWSAHAVIELNAGVVAASCTQVGDQLQLAVPEGAAAGSPITRS